MLQSVDAGGRDVANEPLELSDQSVSGIAIRFADRGNAVSGLVRTKDGLPDSTASVAVFPADPKRWLDYGSQPRDIVKARVRANGTYEIRGCRPAIIGLSPWMTWC